MGLRVEKVPAQRKHQPRCSGQKSQLIKTKEKRMGRPEKNESRKEDQNRSFNQKERENPGPKKKKKTFLKTSGNGTRGKSRMTVTSLQN